MKNFHSGKRLQIAREIKRFSLRDLGKVFNVDFGTIQKWQSQGIPKNAVIAVAFHFGVEEWVFTDEALLEEIFKKIIFDPTLQEIYRPDIRPKIFNPHKLIFVFEGFREKKLYSSDTFHIANSTVLLSVRLWGSKGGTDNQFSIFKKGELELKDPLDYIPAEYYRYNTLYIYPEGNTAPTTKIVEEKIYNRMEEGDYYISAYSKYNFKVFVYEFAD